MDKCVMCGTIPEERLETITNEIVNIYFIDPITKEQLCISCNQVNNEIYRSKGQFTKGELKIIRSQGI